MTIPVPSQPAWELTEIELLREQMDEASSRAVIASKYTRGEETATEEEQALLVMRQWPDLAEARARYVVLLERAAGWQLGHLDDPGQRYLPHAPTGLRAAVSETTAFLTWDAMRGASGYRVYQSPDGGGTWDKGVDVGVANYRIEGLEPGGEYVFGVASVGNGGESGRAAITVRTPAPEPAAKEAEEGAAG